MNTWSKNEHSRSLNIALTAIILMECSGIYTVVDIKYGGPSVGVCTHLRVG